MEPTITTMCRNTLASSLSHDKAFMLLAVGCGPGFPLFSFPFATSDLLLLCSLTMISMSSGAMMERGSYWHSLPNFPFLWRHICVSFAEDYHAQDDVQTMLCIHKQAVREHKKGKRKEEKEPKLSGCVLDCTQTFIKLILSCLCLLAARVLLFTWVWYLAHYKNLAQAKPTLEAFVI